MQIQISRRVLVPAFALLAFSTVAFSAPSAVEQEIRALDKESSLAQKNLDADSLEKILADDLIYAGADGTLKNKQELLAGIRKGVTQYNKLEVGDVLVRIHGSSAIVTARAAAEGTAGGVPFTGNIRYVKVFVLKDKKWKLASWSSTLGR